MTSPVDTSVKFFSSTMVGAPVLSGTAGSLIAWLDAILKDGFDTKTLTSLVAAGGVMTATFTGTHSSLADTVVLIAGVTGGPTGFAGANGEQKVMARPSATTTTWATTLPDGTYTGTITMKMAPLGWLKPFSGTNKAVYKSNDPASSGMYFRVDDSATTVARVVGYESMTDVDTGLGPFPTTAQMSGGGYWGKSNVASATAVAWQLVGDSRIVYHAIQAGYSSSSANQIAALRGFGDPIALRPSGDPYSAFVHYSINSAAVSIDGCLGNNQAPQLASPRSYTGLGSSVLEYPQIWGLGGLNTQYSGVTDVHGAFPNRVDGALYLSKKLTVEIGTTFPRSELPGLYSVMQSNAWSTFKAGDKVPGAGLLTGRTLLTVHCVGSTSNMASAASAATTGVVMVDVTGPWR